MKIIEVTARTEKLLDELLKVWEDSVKATHHFLSDEEISEIKKYVPQALGAIPHLIIAEDDDSQPAAFMGIAGEKLEMLFVKNSARGKGLGKRLVNFGRTNYRVNELTVNEQNPGARGFYEHLGFKVYKRTALDEQGNPYPILYMKVDD